MEEKLTHRSDKAKKDLITRLNKIEGQIRGIRTMIENDKYCTDVINQVAAVTSALNGFNKELLNRHIHSCVVKDIQNGNLESLEEITELIIRVTK